MIILKIITVIRDCYNLIIFYFFVLVFTSVDCRTKFVVVYAHENLNHMQTESLGIRYANIVLCKCRGKRTATRSRRARKRR